MKTNSWSPMIESPDEQTREMILDLENYGFNNYADLTSKHQVSERTIRRRVHNMVQANIIKFVVAPNIVLLGYKAWARIGIKVKLGSLNRVAQTLVANPAIYWVAFTLGRFDLIISVHFDDVDKLAHFINSELMRLKDLLDIPDILSLSEF